MVEQITHILSLMDELETRTPIQQYKLNKAKEAMKFLQQEFQVNNN